MDYLNAFLSGIKGELIPPVLMEEIQKTKDVASIFDLLKKTHYGKHLDYRENIKSSIEKALEKRFIEVIERIKKAVPDDKMDLFQLFIYEYEAKYVLLNFDQKYRNVEHPRLYSLLDSKEKLMRNYKLHTPIGFLKSTTFGKNVNLDIEIAKVIEKTEDRVPIAIDYLIFKIKEELTQKTRIISSIIKKELIIREYILERYLGKKVLSIEARELSIIKELKDKPLEEMEYLLDEWLLKEYIKKYPASWYTIEKAYIILKMLEHEKLQILKSVRA